MFNFRELWNTIVSSFQSIYRVSGSGQPQPTNYGQRKSGNSRFVVVAPHGGGDDEKTAEIAQEVAKQLNAHLVINNKYIKPKNNRAESNPELVSDFNHLPVSRQLGYDWSRAHPHMKDFYDHVSEYSKLARNSVQSGEAVIVYIHGCKDQGDLGIDIGCGLKEDYGVLKSAKKGTRNRHPGASDNSGVRRAKREDMQQLRKTLEGKIRQDHGLRAGIGERFPAWSASNGIQYHAGTPDHSLQLEITSKLRQPETMQYTAKLIADALKEAYKL